MQQTDVRSLSHGFVNAGNSVSSHLYLSNKNQEEENNLILSSCLAVLQFQHEYKVNIYEADIRRCMSETESGI